MPGMDKAEEMLHRSALQDRGRRLGLTRALPRKEHSDQGLYFSRNRGGIRV